MEDKNINQLFKLILGTDVKIKDNIDSSEEIVFQSFINKLENSIKLEEETFELSGMDLTRITGELWFVIENMIKMLYGQESASTIQWYLWERFNPDGTIISLEGPDGKDYKLETPKDLWSYIKYKSNK